MAHRYRRPVLGILWILYVLLGWLTIHFHNIEIVEPEDGFYYTQTAANIASGVGHLTVFNFAYLPPLFSAFLASLMMVGLTTTLSLKYATLLCLSTSPFLIEWICRQMYGPVAGLAGAALFIAFPYSVVPPNYLWSESLFIPLYLLLLAALLAALRTPTLARFGIAGACCGLATLCREITFYMPLVVLACLLLSIEKKRRAIHLFAAFTALHLLVIAPWTIRNFLIFERVIPISTNSWINLYIGNNPHHENVSSWTWVMPEGTSWNRGPQADWRNELEVMARSRQEALRYIRAHPLGFVERSTRRAVLFIVPHVDLIGKVGTTRLLATAVAVNVTLYTLFLIGYAVGLVVAWRAGGLLRGGGFLLLSLFLTAYLIAVAGMTASTERYRLPMTIVFLIVSTQWCAMLSAKTPSSTASLEA